MKSFNIIIVSLLVIFTKISFTQQQQDICGTINANSPENFNIETRPNLPNHYDSPNFRIHYDNNTPLSFVSQIAVWAEQTRENLQQRNWAVPPPDGQAGDNSNYDIYLIDTYNSFGASGRCIPWAPNNSNYYPNSYSSFIEFIKDSMTIPTTIVNNLNSLGISRKDFIKVILTHELVHASQFAYSSVEYVGFYECSAVFAEKQIHPEIDLLRLYFMLYNITPLERPEFSIDYLAGQYVQYYYTLAIWCIFLSEYYKDNDVIRNIWQKLGELQNNNYPDIIETILPDYKNSLKFYGIWRYFTGQRHNGFSFNEGYKWPTSNILVTHNSYPASGPTENLGPNRYLDGPGGAMFIVFTNVQEPLRVTFQGMQSKEYKVLLLKTKNDNSYFDIFELQLNNINHGFIDLINYSDNYYVLIPVLVSSDINVGFNYSASYLPNVIVNLFNRINNSNAGGYLIVNDVDTVTSGQSLTLPYNSSNNVKTFADRFNLDQIYKHKNWLEQDTSYLLKFYFSADENKTIYANFKELNTAIIRNRIDGMSFNDQLPVWFSDPWYVLDQYDNQLGIGNYITPPPLSPYHPTGAYNQSSGGVFLNQVPDTNNPNKPYYSVKAEAVQDIQLSQTGRTHKFYFQGWSANPQGSAEFQDSSALQTPVVFRQQNATVEANPYF